MNAPMYNPGDATNMTDLEYHAGTLKENSHFHDKWSHSAIADV